MVSQKAVPPVPPLFNENKQIVGTLSGGNSTCRLTNGNNLYGKFSYHWNQYSKADTGRMDIWLDPLNTGTTELPGLSQTGEEGSLITYKFADRRYPLKSLLPTMS